MAFKEDVQKYLEKGVKVSKEAFNKAGTAVTKFGDESVLKIEKKQFESNLKKELTALGEETLAAFEGGAEVCADKEPFASRLKKIADIKAEIKKRDELLQK